MGTPLGHQSSLSRPRLATALWGVASDGLVSLNDVSRADRDTFVEIAVVAFHIAAETSFVEQMLEAADHAGRNTAVRPWTDRSQAKIHASFGISFARGGLAASNPMMTGRQLYSATEECFHHHRFAYCALVVGRLLCCLFVKKTAIADIDLDGAIVRSACLPSVDHWMTLLQKNPTPSPHEDCRPAQGWGQPFRLPRHSSRSMRSFYQSSSSMVAGAYSPHCQDMY